MTDKLRVYFLAQVMIVLLSLVIILNSSAEESVIRIGINGYLVNPRSTPSDITYIYEDIEQCVLMLENGVINKKSVVAFPYNASVITDIGTNNLLHILTYYPDNQNRLTGSSKVREVIYDNKTLCPHIEYRDSDLSWRNNVFAIDKENGVAYTLPSDVSEKIIVNRITTKWPQKKCEVIVFDIDSDILTKSGYSINEKISISKNGIIAIYAYSEETRLGQIHFYDMKTSESYVYEEERIYDIICPISWGEDNKLYFFSCDRSAEKGFNYEESIKTLTAYNINTKEIEIVTRQDGSPIIMPLYHCPTYSLAVNSDASLFAVFACNAEEEPNGSWEGYGSIFIDVFSAKYGFIATYRLEDTDIDVENHNPKFYYINDYDTELSPILFFIE